MLAVGAVTPVAMDADDGFADGHDLVAGDVANDIRKARVGGFVAVRGAEAATDEEVVADELAAFDHGDVAHVVGEDVHVVVRRDGEAGLELTRQVGLAVEFVDRRAAVVVVGGRGEVRVGLVDGSAGFRDLLAEAEVDLHAVHPDGVVGGGLRQQRAGQRERIVFDRLRDGVNRRIGRRRDVAVHVAAGGEGGGERLVDSLDQAADAALGDAMELERLARGDAQGAVGETAGELVVHQVLRGGDDAPGLTRAHHDGVFFARLALIAVVLLVDAVELDELLVVAAEAVRFRVGQGLPNRARKVRLFGLHHFILRQGLLGRLFHR